jgi:hypothetical protein
LAGLQAACESAGDTAGNEACPAKWYAADAADSRAWNEPGAEFSVSWRYDDSACGEAECSGRTANYGELNSWRFDESAGG